MPADAAKPKQNENLRTPKPKKRLGLTVPHALRLPHEDLILPLEDALKRDGKENITPTSITSPTTTASQTSMSSPTSPTTNSAPEPTDIGRNRYSVSEPSVNIAPQRDYAKVANSITRHAVPAGLFTGKSKQLYDCLYALTRGAINPSRTARISRPQLMKKAGIGSRITLDTNIERLIAVGLITMRQINGEHSGNEYTVFLPEEIESKTVSNEGDPTSMTSMTSPTQFLGLVVGLETSQSRYTSFPEESTTYGNPKTFFKTDDDDTHTAREISQPILEAARECVGGTTINSEHEKARWREVGQLIAEELRSASKRTSGISSVPAFLAAHLRRRFATPPNTSMTSTSVPTIPTANTSAEANAKTSTRHGAHNNEASDDKGSETLKTTTPSAETERERIEQPSTINATMSAGSRFSLEECRLYAEHLHQSGQGIVNPGGYALTIRRTGEVDELIEKFLKPQAKQFDASLCPDCHGTGFWYPNGTEHGVAKCKHERMPDVPDA